MIKLTCEGSSDDTFGVYGAGPDDDYDNCASCEPIVFRVSSVSDGSLLIVGQYAPKFAGGVWLVGIVPDASDDEHPIPEWPMHFQRSERPYSPQLIIEAPNDVTV